MPEENKNMVQIKTQSEEPPMSLRRAFLVPNLINLSAVLMVLVTVALLLFMPMIQVGAGDRQAHFSVLDMLTDMDQEASANGSALETAGNGNFSEAVTLLALQVSAQGGASVLNSRINLIMASFAWYAGAALLALVILTVMFLILLIKATARFFTRDAVAKMGESYVALLAPLLLLVIPKLASWILGVLKMGWAITGVHLRSGSLLLLIVVGVAALALDIVCYILAQRSCKKFEKLKNNP